MTGNVLYVDAVDGFCSAPEFKATKTLCLIKDCRKN